VASSSGGAILSNSDNKSVVAALVADAEIEADAPIIAAGAAARSTVLRCRETLSTRWSGECYGSWCVHWHCRNSVSHCSHTKAAASRAGNFVLANAQIQVGFEFGPRGCGRSVILENLHSFNSGCQCQIELDSEATTA
jgi:hypothetical protein